MNVCMYVYVYLYTIYIYISLNTGNYVPSALLYSAHVLCFHGHRLVSGAPTIISLFLLGYRRKRKEKKKTPFQKSYQPVILVARGHGKGGVLVSSSLQA